MLYATCQRALRPGGVLARTSGRSRNASPILMLISAPTSNSHTDHPVTHTRVRGEPAQEKPTSGGTARVLPEVPAHTASCRLSSYLEADLRPSRRDWVGWSSLQVAGSRSPRGSTRPRDGHIVLALTSDVRHDR